MSEQDKYYQILGLNSGAPEKEIVEAYKVLVKVWNPGRFKDDPNIQKIAAEKIKAIDEAFKQLLIWTGSPPEKGREIQEPKFGVTTEPHGTRGSVDIQTEPLEAKVYFNEKFVGTSPCKGNHLPVGLYKVRVIKEGYEIWEQDVDIYAGAEKDVFAKLKLKEPESGQLWKDPCLGMKFVFVKGGRFEMGDIFGDGKSDEKPVHWVHVDGFWIGKYQVTQKQWEKVMGNNPFYLTKGANYPVENVNWDNAQEFISKLNKKTGMKYRLPTEAEWEYAARSGGRKEKWAGTSSEVEIGEYAWYPDNSGNTTHPVGEKKPNGLGLYDMSGNVSEWVYDYYNSSYYRNSPQDNPFASWGEEKRVFRGGSWNKMPRILRTSARACLHPRSLFLTGDSEYIGFRLVLPALQEQTSIAETVGLSSLPRKEQPPASGKKPYGTESLISQPDHTNLKPKSYISQRPTEHMDEGPTDGQSVKPPEKGLGVGAKIGLTVIVVLISGVIYGLLREIGHGQYISTGIAACILIYIWSRPSKKANK